jgi:membrane fusion protein (multidrug efflux system)
MAEPVLKSPDKPPEKPADPVFKVVPPKPEVMRRSRASAAVGVFKQYRRLILLVVVPAIAAVIALTVFLMGGRYITTDNAYVGAQKVLITPDVAGKIRRVVVVEGQQVKAGDVLFEIDPIPFQLAVTQAEGRLATVRIEFDNLKTNLKSVGQLIEISRNNVQLMQNDVDRKAALLTSRSGSVADSDNSQARLALARMQLEQLTQQEAQYRNQLLGDTELLLDKYPPYMQASAALDQAKRDLDHTVVRAPISGVATQVDSIQLGRYVTAGQPVFSLMDNLRPWVDANPKETDITFLQLGQKANVYVDTFPGHKFRGTVVSVSPGTGAQFAILPPQNASGNWVKVVQRVPLRIALDPGQNLTKLRSGMSATVDIDTHRRRTFWSLFSDTDAVAERMPK